MAENVLFGSEFDGRPIVEGVNEVVVKLAEIKESLKTVREEVTRLNGELDRNQKELAETKKALDDATKAGDPAKIKALSDQVAALTQKEVELKKALKEANVEQIVLQKGQALYNKDINETVRNNKAAGEELKKFTSVSRLAGEAVGRLRSTVTELGFSVLSGFAGGIIAQVIPALIQWGQELLDVNRESKEVQERHALMNEVFANAAQTAAGSVAKLEAYRKILNDTGLSEKERVQVAKEYNKTADETNKIDTTQINNLDLINQKIDAQNKLIIQRAKSTAALGEITKAETKVIEAELKFQDKLSELSVTEDQVNQIRVNRDKEQDQLALKRTQTLDNFSNRIIPQTIDANKKLADSTKETTNAITTLSGKEVAALLALQSSRDIAQASANEVAKSLSPLITPEGVTTPTTPTTPTTNVFQRELDKLQQQASALQAIKFPSESLIEKSFEDKLTVELANIDKFLDKKSKERVTPEQAIILRKLIGEINDAQLAKDLEEFRKKIQDIQDKIDQAVDQVQSTDNEKRVNNIRDEFEREREAIEIGFQNTVKALATSRDNLLKQIDEAEKAGLDRATAQRRRFRVNSVFGDLVDQATQTKTNQQLDLAFKSFQKTVTESNIVFDQQLTTLDTKTAQQIVAEKNALASGAINYETFQKHITKILKDEKEARDKIRKAELENDLQQINVRITTTTDPEQLKKLQEQARQVQEQINAIDKNVEGQKQDPVIKRIDNVSKYAQSVGSLLNTIGSFWNQVNAIEQKSLERSISLQEKRVEEATRIAERGNAEYLNQEQDRLDQLELKRAASARKQQAINSALVLSNALVATVSAIAQAASTSGPAAPFAAIAAGIAVIGAIVAAFQFVQSLQPPEATFFRGTEDVQLGGNKPGVDTVPARLTEHERVVTARENKDYFETLTAIHNRKVSPEVLNSFVKQTLTGQKDGKGEIKLERTVVERFREKAEKDRLTKVDRQLTKDIAREVSEKVVNNTQTERVFNYVQNVLTERLQNRPLIIPGIMKLIREQVTSKEVTRERTAIEKISEVLDTFSDRIQVVQNMHELKQADRARTSEVIRELSKVITSDKDVKTVENLLTTAIYNPETSKVLIPMIREKLTTNNIQNKGPVESSDKTKEITRIIDRFTEKINGPEREKVISKFYQDRFIQDHREYQTTLETIFDRKIDSKTLNEFVEKSVDRQFTDHMLKQQLIHELETDHKETKFDHFTEVRKMVETARDKTSDFQEVKSNLQLEKYKSNSDHLVERIIENNRLIHAATPVVTIPRTEIPVVSYGRLEQATDHSTEMKGLLSEQIRIMNKSNELQLETNKILKAMDFQLNIDENGLSGRFMKYMHQKEIDKKV
jgi:hypothetical protein